ncbi:hypothetical protein BIW11_11187 [Tropilaelaps mercedesae]|uniref:Uncharacterized protein n=1 Tax=Tropilaelaps mercedesae TaxID=418985 RepID=A0A1V9XCR5_9ACAR|nr:hypothetical protein BIW11_11187 [Tropilaelaps mercedesae]
MPIPRQDLQLSHGLWGFEDDPGGTQLPPVHQTKKTQMAKQEWKRLIDIQRHLMLTQSRESHSSSSSDKEVLRDISQQRSRGGGAPSDGKGGEKNKTSDKEVDDKAKGNRRRVQVKTSTGSRLPPNKSRKSSTAEAVEEAKLQRKSSVSLPVVSRDGTHWPVKKGDPHTRESSTAPELGAESPMARHPSRGGVKTEVVSGRCDEVDQGGIRGEQSVMLHYIDVSSPPTTMRIVDSGYTSIGSGKRQRNLLLAMTLKYGLRR